MVHNYYGCYVTGGEGNVFENETQLLRTHGHGVRQYKCANFNIIRDGLVRKARVFFNSSWSRAGYHIIQDEIRRFKPDVMHVHNFWAVLSPSIFRAAKDLGVATVITPHNYRLVCPGGMFMRRGKVCEDCLDRNPWRVIWHRCYRNSLLASIARYQLYEKCKKEKVWERDTEALIALGGKNHEGGFRYHF